MKPPIKDTPKEDKPPNKGQAKSTLVYTLYRKSPLKEDNLSTKDKTACPKSVRSKRFHCNYNLSIYAEMKEHDVSPEPSGDVVTAEPRPDDEDTVAPEAVEMARDPDSVQSQEEQDLNLGAVSGFLSGFAAAVQSTVSGCYCSLC